jgi:hypothetical protein
MKEGRARHNRQEILNREGILKSNASFCLLEKSSNQKRERLLTPAITQFCCMGTTGQMVPSCRHRSVARNQPLRKVL